MVTPGITNANFHSMLEIVLVMSSSYFIQTDDGTTLPRDPQPLLPGDYFVVADNPVDVNNEIVVTRTESCSTGTRLHEFRDEVRKRDGGCVVSKRENSVARFGIWSGFEAAHIFPLAYEGYWKEQNFGRWVTLPTSSGDRINSVQNGLLLYGGLHTSFDHFEFSINPDDNYKIVCFIPDVHGIAGTSLDSRLLDDDRRPAPELLRWHFRQSVLANMRGAAGEPIFEHDFPPGSDIMGNIRSGPKAAQRMEAELFSRLGASMKLGYESQ